MLDGAFSALRLSHDPTLLLMIDVLLPRVKTTTTSQTTTTTTTSSSSSASTWSSNNENNNMTMISSGTNSNAMPPYELRFDDLMQSTVFRGSLGQGPQAPPLSQQQQQQLQSLQPPPPPQQQFMGGKPAAAFSHMNTTLSSLSSRNAHGLGLGLGPTSSSSQSSASKKFPTIPHATRASVLQVTLL